VPASDIAVSLVHRLVAGTAPARRLPKLELAGGVPPELRTLIAVPTLLMNRADLEQQLERLEVHYLANPEGQLHFALLTDWADADQEHAPGDDELAVALDDGIERSTRSTRVRPGRARASWCCTVGGCGTRRKASGSAGRGNGASSTS
jgi:cyclic beta-1,2-glucan synthetase